MCVCVYVCVCVYDSIGYTTETYTLEAIFK